MRVKSRTESANPLSAASLPRDEDRLGRRQSVRRDLAESCGFELLSQLRKRVRVTVRRGREHRQAKSRRNRRRHAIRVRYELEHHHTTAGLQSSVYLPQKIRAGRVIEVVQ